MEKIAAILFGISHLSLLILSSQLVKKLADLEKEIQGQQREIEVLKNALINMGLNPDVFLVQVSQKQCEKRP